MVHTEPDDEEDYEGDVAFYSTTDSASYLELVELVGKSVWKRTVCIFPAIPLHRCVEWISEKPSVSIDLLWN